MFDSSGYNRNLYQSKEDGCGGLYYHDNNLLSGSLEALIQHLVPSVDYYPDVSMRYCTGTTLFRINRNWTWEGDDCHLRAPVLSRWMCALRIFNISFRKEWYQKVLGAGWLRDELCHFLLKISGWRHNSAWFHRWIYSSKTGSLQLPDRNVLKLLVIY